MSVDDVLQVYSTLDADLPIAPAGAQNAPGVTALASVCVGKLDGVGVGDGEAVSESTGICVV